MQVCHHREALGEVDSENLKMLVEYIFGVAYQTWFYIKVQMPEVRLLTTSNFWQRRQPNKWKCLMYIILKLFRDSL